MTAIIPVMTYSLETMVITITFYAEQVGANQRAMEKSMLGISLRSKITNIEIRRRTGKMNFMK